MTKKRNMLLVLCLVLVTALVSIGGTIAWLTDKTEEVKNTFTVGNIDITLAETKGPNFKMVPGEEIEKDPVVTVLKNSEACWVFVEVTEGNDLDHFITYSIDGDWTKLNDNVYYRSVEASTTDQVFKVLTNNKVTVNKTVTKDDMDKLKEDTYPTLTFKAYAIQKASFATAEAAWAEASK